MSLQQDAKRVLPFIQAMVEGKTVEWRHSNEPLWNEVGSVAGLRGCYECRIKPEKKLRPYTREEWEKVARVRKVGCDLRYSLPVGDIAADSVKIDGIWHPFSRAMNLFSNLDGTPCGVEVEE